MITAEEMVELFGNQKTPKKIHFGKVVDISGKPRVLLDGETTASVKRYPHLSSYDPKTGDKVMILNGTILGRIGANEGGDGDSLIGNMSNLLTENKSTVVGAINELFTNVDNGKDMLETDIIDKGGTVSKESTIATFNELSQGIQSIPSNPLEVFAPGDFVIFSDSTTKSNSTINTRILAKSVKVLRPGKVRVSYDISNSSGFGIAHLHVGGVRVSSNTEYRPNSLVLVKDVDVNAGDLIRLYISVAGDGGTVYNRMFTVGIELDGLIEEVTA